MNEKNSLLAKWQSDIGWLKAILETNPAAFSITEMVPGVITLTIVSSTLRTTDLGSLRKIFNYLYSDTSQCDLRVVIPAPPLALRIAFEDPVKFSKQNFSKDNFSLSELAKDLYSPHIVLSSILLEALIGAMKENGLPVDYGQYAKALRDQIKEESDYGIQVSTRITREMGRGIEFLHEMSPEKESIREAFRVFILFLISSNDIEGLTHIINSNLFDYRELDHKPDSFLHTAMDKENDTFAILLRAYNEKPSKLTDQHGNTFLHVCHNPKYLDFALRFTPDINAENIKGDTPLHVAARDCNITKTAFLLSHNADPEMMNNNGETFWTVSTLRDQPLTVYRVYRRFGGVLNLPPEVVKQRGLTCGFYAIVGAAKFHRMNYPSLFSSELLVARKGDVSPKATISLRQLRTSGIGEIFTVKDLAELIQKTECSSLVTDIKNYEHFLTTIKKGISANLPVLVPFSSDPKNLGIPSKIPSANTAHWATIIGWAKDGDKTYILLSQFGKYFEFDARDLYRAFNEIDEYFPASRFAKKPGGEWQHANEEITDPAIKTKVIPLTSLADFRRKLVFVLPPKYDLSLLGGEESVERPSPGN